MTAREMSEFREAMAAAKAKGLLRAPAAEPARARRGEGRNCFHSHQRRERQSVWCCGLNYQRWAFVGQPFSTAHKTACAACGRRLAWPASQGANEYATAPKRAKGIALRSYHRRAARFERQGLTRHGAARVRAIGPEDRRANWLRNYHRRAARLRGLGLTTRGTARVNAVYGSKRKQLPAREQAWRTFRAELNTEITEGTK